MLNISNSSIRERPGWGKCLNLYLNPMACPLLFQIADKAVPLDVPYREGALIQGSFLEFILHDSEHVLVFFQPTGIIRFRIP